MTIRVAIADDHALVREGLRRMLATADDIEVIGEAEDGAAAVELVQRDKPDVLLLDITMPKKDGIEATGDITALGLDTKVLIVSMHANEQYALRTLHAGASGFVWKGAKLDELTNAVREVAAGGTYIPQELRERLGEVRRPADGDNPAAILSKREFQVMGYLASGMTNREIAALLNISVKTIDTHRGHVLKKLELRNNSDITRFAIQHGFIQI